MRSMQKARPRISARETRGHEAGVALDKLRFQYLMETTAFAALPLLLHFGHSGLVGIASISQGVVLLSL